MKTLLRKLLVITIATAIGSMASAQNKRYIDEVFSAATKTSNIEYDSNRSVNILYGSPIPGIGSMPIVTVSLKCDIYEPAGDTAAKRPLIILLSTGTFLPPIINKQTTGSKDDSAVVEMCTRFAKKGYVAVAMNYRMGWNPLTTVQADAAEQLIKAAYRGMQDVRNCVRYMRVNASTYKIDTSKIIVGGQGTGGYIALGVATLNKRDEIETNPKFLRGDFTAMVNVDTMGTWMGEGGWPYLNYGGDPSVSGNVHMAFNYGGAIGDSAWIEAGGVPIVSLHCTGDMFAPYNTGNVVIPRPPYLVVIPNASGAGHVIPLANLKGVNNKISAAGYADPISPRALQLSGGVKNLYPLKTAFPAESAPWEWWDRTTVQSMTHVMVGPYPIPANGREADSLSMLTNPTMSKAKAMAYIDTIQGFVCPRIAVQFDLVAGMGGSVNEQAVLNDQLSVYPNPSSTVLTIELKENNIAKAEMMDLTGKVVAIARGTGNMQQINVSDLNTGIYLISISSVDGRTAVRRVVVQ